MEPRQSVSMWARRGRARKRPIPINLLPVRQRRPSIKLNWHLVLQELLSMGSRLTLELDTPPKELLVLNYRSVRMMGWAPFELAGERPPYLEWEHDEIDLVEQNEAVEVMQTILFSNGFELQIHFSDFDFATLQPLVLSRQPFNIPEGLVG